MKHHVLASLLVGALLASGGAHAQPSDEAHRLTLYTRTAALAYFSEARTTGGIGGGVGLRDTLWDRYILQADLSLLLGLGSVGALRLGAGVQWRMGGYTPAILATLQTVVGSQLSFLTDAHPTPVRGPAVALGVSLAPVRFTQGPLHLSLLELGVGLGSDFPGRGLCWQMGLVEAGTSF